MVFPIAAKIVTGVCAAGALTTGAGYPIVRSGLINWPLKSTSEVKENIQNSDSQGLSAQEKVPEETAPTTKQEDKLEGRLVFTKSTVNDEGVGRNAFPTYELTFLDDSKWVEELEKWNQDEDYKEDTQYKIPVKLTGQIDKNKAEEYRAKFNRGLGEFSRKAESGHQDTQKLKSYLTKEEIKREFEEVFGSDNYDKLLENIDKSQTAKVLQ
ncbi:hypothetical protein MHLP_04220 [Candidatus Mycoplasma haematolamae str. Purdue]|uniref:Uncharacterized protein n=1 Tax=Mycoplasma haematolamae (strain Purdue) TaxID=1212765 RepID=I7CKK3_MYCHA|nr:hypothetical protein [Candidatus Mycoplasma haematolamae]AFO52424.1 hypothetical protein MHLP_04220 [Candidatus Mycoplasma haematolamae str. Purdue]